jgi:L-alanine-DL-glutamate epimerase-like enolase superfamily enzyme
VKIARIDLLPFDLPLRQPLQTAAGKIQSRSGILIKISDHQGNIGFGEATPLPGFGMESLSQRAIALQQMQPSLLGQEINDLRAIANLLTNFQRVPAARHGIELALLDLLAININKSVAELLSAEIIPREEIRVNALIGMGSPEMAATQAKDFLRQGYDCIKIKVGRARRSAIASAVDQTAPELDLASHSSFAIDYERIAAVRQVGGKDLQIRLDANQSWDLEEAIANLRQLAPLDIEYIEQPLDRHDLAGMAKLRKAVNIPIAADEAVQDLADLDRLIVAQAADVVILKPMAMGGILIAQQAAEIAFQAGLEAVITTTIDGAIAHLGALHLAAAIPELSRACGLATHGFLARNLVTQEVIDRLMPLKGKVYLGDRPGLGISCQDLLL